MKTFEFTIRLQVPDTVADVLVIENIDRGWPVHWKALSIRGQRILSKRSHKIKMDDRNEVYLSYGKPTPPRRRI